MNLQEISKQFNLSAETIHAYEEAGLLRVSQTAQQPETYLEADIDRLGLIDTLVKAGFTLTKIKQYFDQPGAMQIQMLRSLRKQLLGELHGKQRTLDCIDYIIWEKNKR